MSKVLTTTVRFKHKDRILPPGSMIHVHDEDAVKLVEAGHAESPIGAHAFATAHYDYKADPVQMPECGSVNPFRTALKSKSEVKPVESTSKIVEKQVESVEITTENEVKPTEIAPIEGATTEDLPKKRGPKAK